MIKIFVKRILLLAAGYSGVLNLLRFRNRKKIVIFMLHGIVEEKEYPWKTLRKQCSLTRFEQVLAVLQKYFEFVSLDEAVAMLSGETPIRPYCAVLTFDDGYKNNFTSALPCLEKHHIPAVFFIPTGHITSKKNLWFDILDYVVQCDQHETFRLSLGSSTVVFERKDKRHLQRQFQNFLYRYNKQFQGNDYEFQKKIFDQLESIGAQTGDGSFATLDEDPRTSLMSWSEVRKAAQREKILIGSHTVDHLKLATLGNDQIRQQLEQSRKDIEQNTGTPSRYLCYPNGNFDDKVIRIARECGYRAAVTTESHLNEVGAELYRLSRLGFPRRAEKFHILSHIYRGK